MELIFERELPTKRRKCKLHISFNTIEESTTVRVIAYSLINPTLIYFSRYIELEQGEIGYRFDFPISPKYLKLQVFSGKAVEVQATTNYTRSRIKTDYQALFYHVATRIRNGEKTYKIGKYQVNVVNTLPLNSPARIDMATGLIELSFQELIHATVAECIFILLHEYAHYYLGQETEEGADTEALKIYKSWGYNGYTALETLEGLSEYRVEELERSYYE